MAAADYRLCDCCNGKVFYDSNLNYEYSEVLPSGHMALDYLGDWAVICSDCAKTHKTVVLTNEQAAQLAAAPAITPDTDAEREKDLRAMLEKVAREVQAECDKARRVDKWWGFDYKIIDAAIAATKE